MQRQLNYHLLGLFVCFGIGGGEGGFSGDCVVFICTQTLLEREREKGEEENVVQNI